MTTIHLLLASQSPRRREMLNWLGLPCRATSADVDESPHPGESPRDLALRLARAKAAAVQPSLPGEWILAADTTVELDGESLGKPATTEEARTMLRRLRGRPHQVHTAVALRDPATRRETVQVTTTRVWMRSYSDAELEAYVASGDPFDKAGAYAIQHPGFHPIERIEGCYTNVVGLPLCTLLEMLRTWGVNLAVDVNALCLEHFGAPCPCPPQGDSGTSVFDRGTL